MNSNIRRFYSLGTKVVQEGNLAVRDLVLNQDACTLKKETNHTADLCGISHHGTVNEASGQSLYKTADL